jgi:integrase
LVARTRGRHVYCDLLENPLSNVLAAVPTPTDTTTWERAGEAFLRRDLAPGSRRIYGLTLAAVANHLPAGGSLADLSTRQVAEALHLAYPAASPNSWNRHVATLRSFAAFCERHGWVSDRDGLTRALERRRAPEDHSKALSREVLDRLLSDRDLAVRDRCLWRLLYESAARANEVLRLNVEDVDLAARRAIITSKGGDTDVLHFASGTARLLPKVVAGRTRGPLFLTSRPPAPSRTVAMSDLDPATGQARLSYRRAAEIFTDASDGATLHQLRHSAITHLAEDGVPLVLLMAKSRHVNLRTLQRYARPGVEAVARLTAEHDPARRR